MWPSTIFDTNILLYSISRAPDEANRLDFATTVARLALPYGAAHEGESA
jgi:hypothetical protein